MPYKKRPKKVLRDFTVQEIEDILSNAFASVLTEIRQAKEGGYFKGNVKHWMGRISLRVNDQLRKIYANEGREKGCEGDPKLKNRLYSEFEDD